MDKIGIPETGKQEQGRVIPQFEVTQDLLQKAARYVTSSKSTFEGQRYATQEQGTNRKSWRDRLIQADRSYRAILEPTRNYKGFSDKASPILHNNVEMIVARIKESILFSRRDKLVGLEYNSPTKKFREDEINTQFEKQEIEDKVERFVRCAVKFGTGWVKVPLLNQEKTVLTQQLVTRTEQIPIIDDNNEQIIDANGQPMFHVKQSQAIEVVPQVDQKYFGPGYIVIDDIERVYADAFIENPQDQPIIIEEMIVSWEHLMDGVEKGIYFKDQVTKIKGKVISTATSTALGTYGTSTRSETVFGTTGLQFNSGGSDKDCKPKEYKMLQAWCDFAIDITDEQGNKTQRVYPCVISVIGNEVIQLMPNPYFHQMKPYIKGCYKRIEGELYGMSAIDPVLGLYHSYNDTLNQIEDNKVLKLNGITVTKAGNLADQQTFNIGAGEVWYEKETGDIRPYMVDFPMAEGVQYLNQLEEQINKGMGVTPLWMGSGDSTDADKTYRGVTKVLAESEKQFKMISKSLEDAAVRQPAEMFLKVNMQFNPLQNGIETFESINSEVGIKVFGVENYFEKKENAENIINFTMQVASIPGFNTVGLAQTVAELMGIKIDEQKYGPLYSPPPPPAPENKPLNVSVNIPIDPAKGQWEAYMAGQILNQKGYTIDFDKIAQAQALTNITLPEKMQSKSGTLPPQYDSYTKSDKRNKKKDKEDDED